ncbi:DNA translocase FtsK [Bacillus spongiae]|uniref:DNA translocase FtsK n=1 Tax=Bacillus spongiae TaxID=2683610 RepID=UPI003AF40E87
MNWIKRMFQLSKAEEKMTSDFKYGQVDANQDQVSSVKNEIETKMSYQYPKGEFRFPLIPDQKKVRSKPNNDQIQSDVQDQHQEKQKKDSTYEEEKREVTHTYKRPFTPTHIPSPIYGFKERPTKQKEIYYELDSSESAQTESLPETGVPLPLERQAEDRVQETQPTIGLDYSSESAQTESLPETGVPLRLERQAEDRVQETQPTIGLDYSSEPAQTESLPETEVPLPLERQAEDRVQETQPTIGLDYSSEPAQTESLPETEVSLPLERQAEDRVQEAQPAIGLDYSSEPAQTESLSETGVPLPLERQAEDRVQETQPTIGLNAEVDQSSIEKEEAYSEDGSEVRETADALELIPETNNLDTQVEGLRQDSTVSSMEKSADSVNHGIEEPQHNQVSSKPLHSQQRKEEKVESVQKKKMNRHVPFNVFMLNQDRERLAAKKKADAVSKQIESKKATTSHNQIDETPRTDSYQYPSLAVLSPSIRREEDQQWLLLQSERLNTTLTNFNVKAAVVNVTQGPSVTRFEVQPEPGVKVNKITNLSDDIKLSLAAKDIRLEAPIPGKHTIGIEIPNEKSRPVFIREIIESDEFKQHTSPLVTVLGLDISGKPIVTDLKKMPHGLIAGATGSGKSVCINSIIVSLLYKARPDEVKLLLIDPKMVELAPYNQIPHLVSPVITDVKAATASLKWAVEEMERRYELFAHTGVRDISRYNDLAIKNGKKEMKLPFIVIIIDELADLMMMSPGEVEESICRIAQKARACGIHLIIATQRPSVDVITGLIKANVPTRVAFSVSSQVDSRTIIDISGAERLLGKGDMLFLENGSSKSIRLQGTFVSDEEIEEVVKHVRSQQQPHYLFQQEELLAKANIQDEEDELYYDACEFVINQGGASASLLQRRFRIGYNRAARLVEVMEEQGIISEARGSKPREVLVSIEELEHIQ